MGAVADLRADVHRPAHRIEARQQRAQPDVPVGDIAVHDGRVETRSVVGDCEDEAVALPRQPHPHGGGAGVLVDVGKQFPRRPVHQLLRFRLADVLEFGVDDVFAATFELPQQFPDSGRQAELGKHLRMQRSDSRPKSGGRFLKRRVHHIERRIVMPFADLVQLEPRSQQSLQRAVVQMLGELTITPLVRPRRLRHQPEAHVHQRGHAGRSARENEAQRGGGHGQPQQEPEIHINQIRHTHVVVPLRIEDPDREIADRRDESEECGQQRAILKRHRQGQQEEHRQ